MQALYEGRKAGEVQLEDVACTPENIQEPKNLLEKGRLWLEEIAGRIAPGLNLANKLSPLEFRKRVDGRFSVAVNQELALKKSREYLDDIAKKGFEFNPAGGYRPSTLLGKTTKGTLKATVPGGLDMLTTGLFNAYDYTLGEKKNETDKFQKWAVSTGVDLGGSLLTGALAAGVVYVVVYVIGALVAISASALVILTIGVGIFLDVGLELTGVKEVITDKLNAFIDDVQSLPAPMPASPPAIPNPTPPSTPQIYETPMPPSSTPISPSIELKPIPPQPPSTPATQTPEPQK